MTIREMDTPDLPEVAGLCDQLGYPAALDRLRERFAILNGRPGDRMLVAVVVGKVRGWIHVRRLDSLESDAHAEVWGLVVDETTRSRGVGRALLQSAEEWAAANGFTRVRLRSNVIRERAHAFYARAGYEVVKRQLVFETRLAPRPPLAS